MIGRFVKVAWNEDRSKLVATALGDDREVAFYTAGDLLAGEIVVDLGRLEELIQVLESLRPIEK